MDRNGLGHICRQIWLSSHMDHWLSRKFVLHFCTPGVATYQSSSQLVFSCNSDFFSALSYKLDLNLTDSICSNGQQKEESQSLDFQSMQWIIPQMGFSKGLKIYFLSQWQVRKERKKKSSPKTSAADVILRLYARLTGVSSKILNMLYHIFFLNFIIFRFQLYHIFFSTLSYFVFNSTSTYECITVSMNGV